MQGATAVPLTSLFNMSWMLFDFIFKAAAFAYDAAIKYDVQERQKQHPSDFARVLSKLFKALRELMFNASEKQMKGLFQKFFPESTEEEKQAFANELPEFKINMAKLQGHFLKYRDQVQNAISNAKTLLDIEY